jgi:hypothetical protein
MRPATAVGRYHRISKNFRMTWNKGGKPYRVGRAYPAHRRAFWEGWGLSWLGGSVGPVLQRSDDDSVLEVTDDAAAHAAPRGRRLVNKVPAARSHYPSKRLMVYFRTASPTWNAISGNRGNAAHAPPRPLHMAERDSSQFMTMLGRMTEGSSKACGPSSTSWPCREEGLGQQQQQQRRASGGIAPGATTTSTRTASTSERADGPVNIFLRP